MAEQLYGLTSRSAHQVRQKVLDNGGTAGEQTARAHQVRGTTWVKVTGPADAEGWHPGVVSLDTTGTWEDQTNVVLVSGPDAEELVEDVRYLCTRTGDDTFDETATARFRALPVGGGSGDVKGPASATNNAIALFDGTTGKLLKNSVVTINSLGTASGSAGFSGSYGYGYFGYYATDTTSGTRQVILQTSIVPYSVPGLSVNNGGSISYLLNVSGSWQVIVQPSGTFLLSGNGGGTHAVAYAVTRGSAFSPTNYSGIDATCTVKVSGVDKTMSIVGGIIVGIF